MKAKPNTKMRRLHRKGERGAALLSTLMIATIVLAAGGALVVVTNMSATTAVDSTSEMQAYYAAESGLNAAINILRGNVASNPSGTNATFRNAVTNSNLSPWIGYNGTVNGTSVVQFSNPFSAYSVTVTDPDSIPAPDEPDRLVVRVTGYGPRGSIKRMEAVVNRLEFDYSPAAMLLMRGSTDSPMVNMNFAIGESNAKDYSGYDRQYPADAAHSLPVFGTTNASDTTVGETEVDNSKPNTVTGAPNAIVSDVNASLPYWLQSADEARAFLNTLQSTAQATGRYFTSTPDSFGSTSSPQFTFIDGDVSLTGSGAGVLVCTGTLTLNGNFSFEGLVLVLGEGAMRRSGGGNGDIFGNIIVSAFERTWPAEQNGDPHPFLQPTFDTRGGGNSTVQYDSLALQRALNSIAARVVGVREY